jgi:hypothetical protein
MFFALFLSSTSALHFSDYSFLVHHPDMPHVTYIMLCSSSGDKGDPGERGDPGDCPDLLPLIKGGTIAKGIKGDKGESGQKGVAGYELAASFKFRT